jgi:hypothetical protein
MKSELQKLKERLNAMLSEIPVNSQEALYLSRKIDILIVEQYRTTTELNAKRSTYPQTAS